MAKTATTSESDFDARDQQIIQLTHQVASLEDFANAVVEQRNAAYNELAQYKAQIIRQTKPQPQGD